ncbi:hypothetical protein D9615_010295 [Tricholomella constricta]|uniref:F-box domain-containing protein n=1 Tax=Tricholomella constricta TaxID=117010 RepID=A0A8H5GPI3_9AGAR|nr:hypothetical protein D9615_010295 [Tricholomella constricta]
MPNELLLAVFEYTRQGLVAESSTSPSLFPYSVASVCSSWRDLISSVPAYWTRVVLFIDERPTTVYDTQLIFRSSRNLPIDVDIIRRTYVDQNDPNEGTRLKDILDVMRPHLYRCRSIRLDVLYSSSLPSIGYFSCDAPLLKFLNIDCRIFDGSSRTDEEVPRTYKWPLLTEVALDGQTFYDICKAGEDDCLSRLFPHDTFNLTISQFTPSKCDRPGLSFVNTMCALGQIPDLQYLRLSGVELLDDRATSFKSHAPDFTALSELVLEDLGAETMDPLLAWLPEARRLFIVRCAFFVTTHPPDSIFLVMVNIDEEQPIAQVLSAWDGRCLTFEDCPAFDDAFLAMLGGNERQEDEYPGCTYLHCLTISDCTGFSVAALKEMIRVRRTVLDEVDPYYPGVIQVLSVKGLKPVLSCEDEEWFMRNVEEFRWERDEDDGESEAESE